MSVDPGTGWAEWVIIASIAACLVALALSVAQARREGPLPRDEDDDDE